MLRQGPAERRAGCADLYVRVHLLCRLRRNPARWPLPELWRRTGAPTDTSGQDAGQVPGVDQTGAQEPRCLRASGLTGRAASLLAPLDPGPYGPRLSPA